MALSTQTFTNLITNPRAGSDLVTWSGSLAVTRSATGGPAADCPSYGAMTISTAADPFIWREAVGSPGDVQGSIAADSISSSFYVGTYTGLRKYNSTGTSYSSISSGTAGTTSGIGVSSTGIIYVLCRTNSYNGMKIQRFSPAGAYVTEWTVVVGVAGDSPRFDSITVESSGNVLFLNSVTGGVTRYSSTGTVVSSWSSVTGVGVEVAPTGDVYILKATSVRVYSSTGDALSTWPIEYLADSIACGADGSVYVSHSNGIIHRFSAAGEQTGSWSGLNVGEQHGLSIAADGSLLTLEKSPTTGATRLSSIDINAVSSAVATMSLGPYSLPVTTANLAVVGSVAFAGDAIVRLSVGWIVGTRDYPYAPDWTEGATATISSGDGWIDLPRLTAVVPSGFARVMLRVTLTPTGGATILPAGSVKFSGFALVGNSDDAPYSGESFDGEMAAAGDAIFRWTGAAHASTSTATYTFPEPIVPLMMARAMPMPDPVDVGVIPREFKKLQLTGFSVIEDSTPVDPSDTTGGYGQFTLNVDENEESTYLLNVPIDLIDKTQGTTRGTIRGIASNNGDLTLTADSRMALLSVDRQAAPFEGTLGQAFENYLALCGITSGLVIDAAIASRAVIFPGWNGNAWDNMKKMAVAEQVELSLVSNNVVMRELRQRVAENYRDSSRAWTLDTSQLARSVEIYYYNNEYLTSGLAFPHGGWNEDVPIYSVDAGETQVFEITLQSSLLSIVQPTCVDWVDRYHSTSSVYSVMGTGTGSDLPVPPAQWAAGGGSVTVEIGEDTTSLKVTVIGSSEAQYAPYRIAMTAGSSNDYSSLRIVGEGVFTDKQKLTLGTSANPDRVSQEVGATVDNPFISTQEQARALGLWSLKRFGAPRHTINVATTGVNRLGDTGSYRYPTIAEFNTEYAGQTIADFNATWAGKTIREFNDVQNAKVRGDFANQAFGNVAGARIRLADAMFRIRTATTTPFGITYAAEDDTTIADFNAAWDGMTIADFNAEWVGRAFSEFAVAPLKRS